MLPVEPLVCGEPVTDANVASCRAVELKTPILNVRIYRYVGLMPVTGARVARL
jgi:hypothetical protein